MRILFIDRYFYPDKQATACLLTDLAERLTKKHKITVCCGYPLLTKHKIGYKYFLRREEYKDIAIFRIISMQLNKENKLCRWFNYLSFIFTVSLFVLFIEPPDLAVVMTSPPLVGISAYILKKIKKVPYLYICQDIIPESALGAGIIGRKSFLRYFINFLNVRIMKNAIKVVALGEKMRQRLKDKGLGFSKIEIISNWTNAALVKVLPKDNLFSRQYKLQDKFVVLYAGNLGLSHNLEDLIFAADKLRDFPDIFFLMVGEGSAKKRIMDLSVQLGLKKIIFLPFREPEEMNEVLACADVSVVMLKKGLSGFVVPSRIYSILASARSVLGVVDEDSEIAQIIKEANCGEVVEPGKPILLSECILKLYRNRALLKEYAQNAFNYACRTNFKESSLTKYEELIDNLIKSKC